MKRKVWDVTVKDNPNRVVMGENDEFYTTDTEAYLVFNLQDKDFSPPSAVLTLENRNDGSLKDETVDVVDGLIEWEMPQRYIEHFGNWQGQLVYYDPKEDVPEDTPEEDKFETYTSAPFSFVVNAHIGDRKKPSLVEIENWEKFIREGTELIETWEDLEALREENERQRQENYQELLDTGVLQTNINQKLADAEQEYAPRLTELEQNDADLTAQLAQTENVLNERVSQTIATAGDGTIPSELTDMRIKADGTTSTTAGDSLRQTQSGEAILPNAVHESQVSFLGEGRQNVYDPLKDEYGRLHPLDGTDIPETVRMRTGYLPLNNGLSADGVTVEVIGYIPSNPYFFIYEEKGGHGTHVTDYIQDGNNYSFTVNGDFKYFRTLTVSGDGNSFIADDFKVIAQGKMNADILRNHDLDVRYVRRDEALTLIEEEVSKRNLSLSIMGDSISTFKGWVPPDRQFWYSETTSDGTEVLSATQTWWYQLLKETGMKLLANDSWSGSSVANATANGDTDESHRSFISRYNQFLGSGNVLKEKPDVIIIFGGTNDSSRNTTVGTIKYSDWTAEDLKTFGGAFSKLLSELVYWNPTARIINISSSVLKPEYKNIQTEVCDHFNIENVDLGSYTGVGSHPNVAGMTTIKNELLPLFQ